MAYVLDYDIAYLLTPVTAGMGLWSALGLRNDARTAGMWYPGNLDISSWLYISSMVSLVTFFFEDYLIYGVMLSTVLSIVAFALAADDWVISFSDFGTYYYIYVPTFVAWTIDAYALLHYFVFDSDDDMAEDDDAAEDDTADEGSSSYGGYYYYY